MAHAKTQQHPISVYLWTWALLFILSTCSYLVDYFGLEGHLRWSLILLFMVLKAGLIVAVFMHMAWERLALIYAVLVPPRSEEHTSELQSHSEISYAVFCLKKKKNQ